ncbi:MAG: hypothetical protein MK132_27540 [Lentisphaerales bacterium]|nr:hypothetical protein [Lentisphaerales bacterium]
MNRLEVTKRKFADNESGASKFINIGEFKRDVSLEPIEHAINPAMN